LSAISVSTLTMSDFGCPGLPHGPQGPALLQCRWRRSCGDCGSPPGSSPSMATRNAANFGENFQDRFPSGPSGGSTGKRGALASSVGGRAARRARRTSWARAWRGMLRTPLAVLVTSLRIVIPSQSGRMSRWVSEASSFCRAPGRRSTGPFGPLPRHRQAGHATCYGLRVQALRLEEPFHELTDKPAVDLFHARGGQHSLCIAVAVTAHQELCQESKGSLVLLCG
jgi:hypothetical protein